QEAVRRLEAGQAASRRRNAHRSAGVRAERGRREPCGHGDCRTAARPARDARGSEPSAAGASPAATATAEPLLDPPATRRTDVSHGFQGAPIGSLRPPPPNANPTLCVFASGITP